MNAAETKKAEGIVNEFLDNLGVSAKAKVFTVEEYLKIEIEGKDSSLLIGFHGDNLRALRYLISIIMRKHFDEDSIVHVDVAGYLSQKEEKIKNMAQKAIDKYEKTKKPQDLPEMNSYERRIAHSYISDAGYTSESVGEGRDRHIIVSKQ
jgi:spoIIIJ-associated protein